MAPEIESEIAQIAAELDKNLMQITANRFLRAVQSQDVNALFPPPSVEDQATKKALVEAGEQKITRLLMSTTTSDEAYMLAAKHLIRATIFKRLADAHKDALDHIQTTKEQTKYELRIQQEKTAHWRKKNALLPSLVRKDQARRGALAKDKKASEVRRFVKSEWQLYKAQYNSNKSAFARDYAARLRNEFTDPKGEPFKITEKTIREVWLRNTPDAGNQAG